jgi:hypothetical protein
MLEATLAARTCETATQRPTPLPHRPLVPGLAPRHLSCAAAAPGPSALRQLHQVNQAGALCWPSPTLGVLAGVGLWVGLFSFPRGLPPLNKVNVTFSEPRSSVLHTWQTASAPPEKGGRGTAQ